MKKREALLGVFALFAMIINVEESFSETDGNFQISDFGLDYDCRSSLYLASLIGHPLRKLATAALSFKTEGGLSIFQMSSRQDEIGELSTLYVNGR